MEIKIKNKLLMVYFFIGYEGIIADFQILVKIFLDFTLKFNEDL